MTKSIGAIIPVLDENRYYENGDLASFGGTTLAEWKLSQLKNLSNSVRLYISTPSENVKKCLARYNVEFIDRDKGESYSDVIEQTLEKVNEETVVWLNPTSPFLGGDVIEKIIDTYFGETLNGFSGVVSGVFLKEYAFFKGQKLNFSSDFDLSRTKIDPVFISTNGCFVHSRESLLECKSLFGGTPYLYGLGKLSSIEIKELDDIVICNSLIAKYLKSKPI